MPTKLHGIYSNAKFTVDRNRDMILYNATLNKYNIGVIGHIDYVVKGRAPEILPEWCE